MEQVQPTPAGSSPSPEQLAGLWNRAGGAVLDGVLQGLPYVGFIPGIVNGVFYRRGQTIGLKAISARIVRENGDVSGFFHTAVRQMAALLSLLALGFGYWTAFWDPRRQTWHDKLLKTCVLRDTAELAARQGTSSRGAIIAFWVSLVLILVLMIVLILVLLALGADLGEVLE